MSTIPNCAYCHSSDVIRTAAINSNPTWKCNLCGGLTSAIKRTAVTTTLGHATKLFSQYIHENMKKGMKVRDAVFIACKTLGIKLSDENLHNLIVSVEQEQLRLVQAKDEGLNVAAGQVVQVVDPEQHKEMLQKVPMINDSYTVRRKV